VPRAAPQGALFRAAIRFPQQLSLEHHLPCHRVIDPKTARSIGDTRWRPVIPSGK